MFNNLNIFNSIFIDEFNQFDILSLRARDSTGLAMRLVGKFSNWLKESFSDSKPRMSLQEECARYYTTCILIACGLPPAPPDGSSEEEINRSFIIASNLNQEFDSFIDKFNPTLSSKQWKNEVVTR